MNRPTSRHGRTLAGVLVLALTAVLIVLQSPAVRLQAQCGANAIVCENAQTGAPKSEWDVSGAGDSTIQGFATDISVNKGGVVHFKVNTPAAAFNVNIYRLGYYAGNGARKVASIANVAGGAQPACLQDTSTFLVDCGNWRESTSWTVPATAVSGIYIAKLIRSDTLGASHIPFIVRDDASTSDLLFQTSDTTWQAYNQYGGFSLYLGNPIKAVKVSYNRPFSTRSQTGGFGPSDYLFYAEYPTVRWLEANGYDVSYTSGIDTDRNGTLLRNHKAFLSVGHDEYWSGPQRTNVEAARAAGVHLAFLSGNEIFWKTRWENSIDGTNTPYRTLVCYKDTIANAPLDPSSPTMWTGTWRDPRFSPPRDGGKPENALSGQLFTVDRGSTNINVPSTFSNLRFWRNTGIAQLAPGQTGVLSTNTLGYEWDEDVDNGFRPAGLIQLSSTTFSVPEHLVDFGNSYVPEQAKHALTLYRHSSGALVFGAGTVQWAWGLDPNHDITPDSGSPTADVNIQQATMNLLADMGAQPLTRQAGLAPASPSTDVAPPASTITSPVSGVSLPAGVPVTITGTAIDTGGGVVGGVEISTDGGVTWHRANGRQNWTYTWLPGVLGPTSLRSRAADDSGNLEQPTASVGVTVTQATCPCSIWNNAAVPWQIDSADASGIEVGVRFQSDINGQITGLRFYKASTNTGTHTGHLWTASGTLLGSLTFSGESASGWQQANFATPIGITAGTTYIASYFAPVGHYSADSFYFGRNGVDQWPLHALAANTQNGPNGVFIYSTTSAFPNQTSTANNYWVDVVLGPTDTVPPTVSVTAPANGATVSGTVAVSATAGDNNGVSGVQFKLDGVNLGAEVTTAPYGLSWNTTLAANGAHTLSAVARDVAGNTTTASITVNVSNVDTTPPTVSITSPVGGATVSGTVGVIASASDNVGIAGVQLLLDGAPLGAEITAAPYSISWDTTTATNASHTLSARARDFAGNAATSAIVTINVLNIAPVAPVIDIVRSADQATAQTTVATTAFSTAKAGELLLAFVSADYSSGASTTVTGITGGGLTWQLVRRTNVQSGTAEIWRAFAGAPLSNVTVSAALSQAVASSLTVVAFSNVDTSGTNGSGAIGATASANANPGAPSAALTTTRANSWVFGVGTDWDRPVGRTVGAGQTLVHQYMPPVGDTYWVQSTTSPTPAVGTSVTINDTAPTNDRFNLTICEVLPPAGPTFSVSGSITPSTIGSGATVTLSGSASATAIADATGSFSFGGLANGSYTLTPSKSGITFTPANQTVTIAGANVAAVTFSGAAVPTTVPNVVGLTQAAATTAIASANLVVGTVASQSSATVPAGSVISQNPAGGTSVAVGSAVALVVSSGPPTTAVPNVVGLTQAAATSAITAANLVVGTITSQNSATVPAGSVISQNPAGGATAIVGSAVALVVSLGPGNVTVPNVIGLTQSAATSAITAASLAVGPITSQNSTTVPAGSVISQSPAGGTSVAAGSAVALVISLGPPTTTVPNVVGLTQASATTAITGANLVVGSITSQNSATVPAGSVISQNPAGGAIATVGSAVALVISLGPAAAVPTVDKTAFSEGAGTRTTTAFVTAAANERIVAFAASDGPPSVNSQTLTISGSGLTWTRVQRAATRFGVAEIWTAVAPAGGTSITVTSTQASTGFHQSLTVVAFQNVSAIGASAVAGAISGAASLSLVSQAAGSLVYGVGNDWDSATARTLPAGQTMVHQFVDSAVGDTFWVQAVTSPTTAVGQTVTVNTNAPTADQWNFAIVELRP